MNKTPICFKPVSTNSSINIDKVLIKSDHDHELLPSNIRTIVLNQLMYNAFWNMSEGPAFSDQIFVNDVLEKIQHTEFNAYDLKDMYINIINIAYDIRKEVTDSCLDTSQTIQYLYPSPVLASSIEYNKKSLMDQSI